MKTGANKRKTTVIFNDSRLPYGLVVLTNGSELTDQKIDLEHINFFRSVEAGNMKFSSLVSTSFAWKKFFKNR